MSLEDVAKNFSSLNNGFVTVTGYYVYKTILPVLIGKQNVLEVGCADGSITRHLVNHDINLTCVDGSKTLLNNLQCDKKITKIYSLLEKWQTDKKFDFILCSLILEHVEDVNEFMKKLKKLCHTDTVIFFAVPNAFSFHRQAAHSTQMINSIDEFSELDYQVEHKRYYNPHSFREHVSAHFNILNFGGIMFKPLTDNDMVKCNFSVPKKDLHEMYFNIGQTHPTECSLITATCMLKEYKNVSSLSTLHNRR